MLREGWKRHPFFAKAGLRLRSASNLAKKDIADSPTFGARPNKLAP
jgi:hypothetical protein